MSDRCSKCGTPLRMGHNNRGKPELYLLESGCHKDFKYYAGDIHQENNFTCLHIQLATKDNNIDALQAIIDKLLVALDKCSVLFTGIEDDNTREVQEDGWEGRHIIYDAIEAAKEKK